MNWLDRLMDRMTTRGTKIVASGHPPADTEPATGSEELSEELEADYGSDSPAAAPPQDAPEAAEQPTEGADAAETDGTPEEREIGSGDGALRPGIDGRPRSARPVAPATR
jgi:hypothetical protein